jgi:hypothetical protein
MRATRIGILGARGLPSLHLNKLILALNVELKDWAKEAPCGPRKGIFGRIVKSVDLAA